MKKLTNNNIPHRDRHVARATKRRVAERPGRTWSVEAELKTLAGLPAKFRALIENLAQLRARIATPEAEQGRSWSVEVELQTLRSLRAKLRARRATLRALRAKLRALMENLVQSLVRITTIEAEHMQLHGTVDKTGKALRHHTEIDEAIDWLKSQMDALEAGGEEPSRRCAPEE